MPISSLVIHLVPQSPSTAGFLADLAGDRRLTLGARVGDRLPLVVDAEDANDAEAVFTQLRDHEAVAHVDVVFVELPVEIPGVEPC